jgi:hypothetical protein
MFEGYVTIMYVGIVLLFSLTHLLVYTEWECVSGLSTHVLTRLLIRLTIVVYLCIVLLLLVHWGHRGFAYTNNKT